MEEKKTEERNEVVYSETDGREAVTDESADDGTAAETAAETAGEPEEERRGLFGAKKRERNEKAITIIYAVAGAYLLYTAYMTAKEMIAGNIEPGRDTIINIAFTVIFAVAGVWILFSSWRLHNTLKAKEEEAAEKLAAEMAERGETPEEPVKGGLLGGILAKPDLAQPSVASRAAVYYNPADEDDEAGKEEAGEDGEEEKPEPKAHVESEREAGEEAESEPEADEETEADNSGEEADAQSDRKE